MPGNELTPGTQPVCDGLPGSMGIAAMSKFRRLSTLAPARLLSVMPQL